LIDAIIYIFLGLFLYQIKSQIAAWLMFIYAIGVFIITALAKAGIMEGGTNIFLAAMIIWISFRAIKATTYLETHK